MIVGIDASNIRAGGGLTHLVEMLAAAQPGQQGIDRVVVWGDANTLGRIGDRKWLDKTHVSGLERPFPARPLWQRFKLPALVRERVDVLFSPGGTFPGGFSPVVAESQNQLPFNPEERGRFGASTTHLRYLALLWQQTRTFRNAEGVIVLTDSARERILEHTGPLPGEVRKIAYGVDAKFFAELRAQEPLEAYSESRPFRLVYVSTVSLYKHQWHVVEAAGLLRQRGLPVALDLVGPVALGEERMTEALDRVDPDRQFASYVGRVPHETLPDVYRDADAFVFASSCESLPNILVEAMASSCPIACSDRGPMPEVLGEAGVYFDPESPTSIADAVEALVRSPEDRARFAARAHEAAKGYSWKRCADETFQFLAEIAHGHAA